MLYLQVREGRERVGQSDALEKKTTIYFVTFFYIIFFIQQFHCNTSYIFLKNTTVTCKIIYILISKKYIAYI